MKELFIVRHAKSSWDYPDLSDHERPLLEKGKKRTRKMIAFLQSKGVKPDLVLTSSALRARETAGYLAVGLGLTKEDIQIEPGFMPQMLRASLMCSSIFLIKITL